jgi:hypothetical protein
MVMEWVDGRLLRQIMNEQGKLPSRARGPLTVAICQALEYIHANGVVHRDLKPENIMVDADDNIRLIDFGIAGKRGSRRLTFANFSRNMGTPDYISPEQVKGKRGDARSDVYSLGVMLYEMLTGKTPFSGPNPFAVMNDRLLNYPVAAARRSSRRLRRSCRRSSTARWSASRRTATPALASWPGTWSTRTRWASPTVRRRLPEELAGRSALSTVELFEALADAFTGIGFGGEIKQALVGGGILKNSFGLAVDGEDNGALRLLELLNKLGGVIAEGGKGLGVQGDVELRCHRSASACQDSIVRLLMVSDTGLGVAIRVIAGEQNHSRYC